MTYVFIIDFKNHQTIASPPVIFTAPPWSLHASQAHW